jgi:hypothetical protein
MIILKAQPQAGHGDAAILVVSFERSIESKGWNVVDSHFNLLEGNDRLEDRGSIYMLIKKEK